MKTFTIACLLLLPFAGGFAQNSNAVFFTDDGERFVVFWNGQRQNPLPETNVKVLNQKPAAYKAKIVFDNQALGAIEKMIELSPGTETTFTLTRKKESGVLNKGKKIGNALARDLNIDTDTTLTSPYKMKFISETALQPPSGATNTQVYTAPPQQPATTTKTTAQPAQTKQAATTTEKTTVVVQGDPQPKSNVNVSFNVNTTPTGAGVNINASEGTYHETHTTTVTTTTTSGAPATTVYVMPGYSGPVGCPWPVNDRQFNDMKNSIASKSFEDSKLQIAKQITASNCLIAQQVKEIMMLFTFENTRLDYAKYAYAYTFDIGNYYKVNDAFQFETSIDELNDYISGRE